MIPDGWRRLGALLRTRRTEQHISIRALARAIDGKAAQIEDVEYGYACPADRERLEAWCQTIGLAWADADTALGADSPWREDAPSTRPAPPRAIEVSRYTVAEWITERGVRYLRIGPRESEAGQRFTETEARRFARWIGQSIGGVPEA